MALSDEDGRETVRFRALWLGTKTVTVIIVAVPPRPNSRVLSVCVCFVKSEGLKRTTIDRSFMQNRTTTTKKQLGDLGIF